MGALADDPQDLEEIDHARAGGAAHQPVALGREVDRVILQVDVPDERGEPAGRFNRLFADGPENGKEGSAFST